MFSELKKPMDKRPPLWTIERALLPSERELKDSEQRVGQAPNVPWKPKDSQNPKRAAEQFFPFRESSTGGQAFEERCQWTLKFHDGPTPNPRLDISRSPSGRWWRPAIANKQKT
jgi:hypothetical protein